MKRDLERKRVVIYARVSTEHEAQVYALENQLEWYDNILMQRPDWELVGQYVDKGITGTSAKARVQFMKMIEDARRQKFDLILTREVSRFARNTVDTLQYTRLLKSRGVEVFFINDNIRTFDGDGELRLSIMATLAQDESRKTSLRVKAGLKTAMEKGVLFGTGNILGYDRVGRDLVINPEQAQTVRMIFDMYLAGQGYTEIARHLESLGRKTGVGRTKWWPGAVGQILKNSFYCGRIVYNKEYVEDYLTHKIRVNYGEIPQTVVEGTHEPIVTVEEYETVLRIMASRRTGDEGPFEKHAKGGKSRRKTQFGILLECECGASMHRKKWSSYHGTISWAYQCYNTIQTRHAKYAGEDKTPCSVSSLHERSLITMANMIFAGFLGHEENRRLAAQQILEKTVALESDLTNYDKILELKKAIDSIDSEYERMVELLKNNKITPGVFTIKNAQMQENRMQFEAQLEELKAILTQPKKEVSEEEIEEICRELTEISQKFEHIDVDEYTLYRFVERIVVHEGEVDWYLCYNPNPYLNFKYQYSKRHFQNLSRIKLYSEDMVRPDVYLFYHVPDTEPNYRWKDIKVNIFV